MPLRRSHKVALAATGLIAGWISLSVVSNWKHLRFHYGMEWTCEEENMEFTCRQMKCQIKYFYFIPFSQFWIDKEIGFNSFMACARPIYDDISD
tara:strand:+ start:62 stop:343 length:282 start_codon:yes stop_codon:yes gene_type:complete